MIRTVARTTALVAALAAGSALIAKQYVDYTPNKGVWEVNQVDVDPNHVDDYLVGLKRTQVPVFEIMKKRGLVDDYKFLIRQGYTKNHPSVIIMIHYTSVAALEPNKARDEAIEKEVYAQFSEADSKTKVAEYEKYRSFIDDGLYGEVTFTK